VIFPPGACKGHRTPYCTFGTPIISPKLLELESWNSTNAYKRYKYSFRVWIFSARGVQGVQHPYCTKFTIGVLRPLHAPWRKKNHILKDYLTLPKWLSRTSCSDLYTEYLEIIRLWISGRLVGIVYCCLLVFPRRTVLWRRHRWVRVTAVSQWRHLHRPGRQLPLHVSVSLHRSHLRHTVLPRQQPVS